MKEESNLLPLISFIVIAWILVAITKMENNPRFMPTMIGKQLQSFQTEAFTSEDLKKEVSILNIWASWCVSCKAEHANLMALKESGYKIYGLAVADKKENADAYLAKEGNPYYKTGYDPNREIMISLGATGTPETYVINTDGMIYFHQRGMVDAETINKKIIPIINELKKKK